MNSERLTWMEEQPTTTSPAALSLSLADIAALARVQRPVVTTWRSRSRATAHPFPTPLGASSGQERFAVDDVVAWLTATGRGSNPDAAAEAVLHAEPAGSADVRRRHADSLTALLALSAARDTRLTGLSAAELLDAADAEDPDDDCLYREIAAFVRDTTDDRDTRGDVDGWAALADATADAAWNAAAAVERLVTEPGRVLSAGRAATALVPVARELVAALVAELVATQTGTAAPVVIDHTPAGTDALPAVLARVGEAIDPVVRLEHHHDENARLTRRLLCAQRRPWTALRPDDVPAAALHLLQLPSTIDARDAFRALDGITLGLTDADRALVLGHASLLVDAANGTDTGRRADLLRTGRVRCIVRLPAGLLPGRSRDALALWVLGPAMSWPDSDDQFTLVADLTGRPLDDVVAGELVSDVAATLAGAHGERDQFAARAFRFGRLVPTRTLVATGGALVTSTKTPQQAAAPAADRVLAVERLLASVAEPLPGLDGVRVGVADEATPPTAAASVTVGALIAAGHLRCLPGTRIAVDADAGTGSGTLVLDAGSLSNPGTPHRHVDLLAFTRAHPSARLTEPGDVVFTVTGVAGSGPAAVVDLDGGAVVAFPARILRIDGTDPGGLNSAVLAADINARDDGDRRWQQWRVHRVRGDDAAALTATLQRVDAARRAAQQRLADLQQLARSLTAGVAVGSITLNPSPPIERKH